MESGSQLQIQVEDINVPFALKKFEKTGWLCFLAYKRCMLFYAKSCFYPYIVIHRKTSDYSLLIGVTKHLRYFQLGLKPG